MTFCFISPQSGNMVYDSPEPKLHIDPNAWAAHNKSPFKLALTLAMKLEVKGVLMRVLISKEIPMSF